MEEPPKPLQKNPPLAASTISIAAPESATPEGYKGTLCHAAQIVVNELVFKLLCSYRRENQA